MTWKTPTFPTFAAMRRKYKTSKPGKSITLSPDVAAAVTDIVSVRGELAEAKKHEDTLKGGIAAEMKDAESADAGDYTVWWKSHYPDVFDTERFAEEHPKLYEAYLKPTHKRAFDIRVKGAT